MSFYLNTFVVDAFGPLFPWKPIFYYRLVNLLIHVLVSTVLVGLARELTGRVSTVYAVGFLFLVHPLASEPVMYVSQRFQSLATLWMFVAAWSYTRFRRSGDWRSGDRRWLLARLSRVQPPSSRRNSPSSCPYGSLSWNSRSLEKWDWRYLYLVPIGEIVLWRFLMYLTPSNETVFSAASWWNYLLTQGPVLLQYLQLSVYPAEQFLFYDFPFVTAFSWPLVLQWAVVLSVLATGLFLSRRYPIIGFGILTFFVLLLPVILVPRPNLVFEYRAYGSLGGIALALGTLLTWRPRPVIAAMTVVLIAALGIRTFERSAEWNDQIAFFESHRTRFPDDPLALSYLAVHYASAGQVIKAHEILEHAQANTGRLNLFYAGPARVAIGLNLVTSQMALGQLEAAGETLELLQRIDPSEPAVAQVQGNWFLAADQPEEAAAAFERMRELDPDNPVGWQGLQIAYSRLGREDEAAVATERLLEYQEARETRSQERWLIPLRYRTHVIFGMLLIGFGFAFVSLRFAWSIAREQWSGG